MRTSDQVRQRLAPYIETLQNRLDEPSDVEADGVTLDEIDERIARQAGQDLRCWSDSPEGQAFLEALGTMSLEQIQQTFDEALTGPHFRGTRELLERQRATSRDASSIPYQTISLGVMAEGDVGVGLYGSIGYAADLTDIEGSSVVYLSGAIIEGVEVGAAAGVQVGIWKDKTDDLSGYYNAQQASITDIGGAIVTAYESSFSLKGLTLDIVAGVDDGIAEMEVVILTIDISHEPVIQDPKSHFLILTSLVCNNKDDVSGHDEISLQIEPDGSDQFRYPTWDSYSMSDDSTDPDHEWGLGRSVYFDQSVDVKLYESGEQICDTETINLSDFDGPGSTTVVQFEYSSITNDIDYQMTAQLVF